MREGARNAACARDWERSIPVERLGGGHVEEKLSKRWEGVAVSVATPFSFAGMLPSPVEKGAMDGAGVSGLSLCSDERAWG